METFVVRVFVAEDVGGFTGTVQRPGEPPATFHSADELVRFLHEMIEAEWAADPAPSSKEAAAARPGS
jgi:hypothetical protein